MNQNTAFRLGRQAARNTRTQARSSIPSLSHGLRADEILASRRMHGTNRLTHRKPVGFLRRFLSNLNDPIIKILIAAMIINTVFTISQPNWAETGGIALTVLISALVTTLSENASGSAFEKLYNRFADVSCRVIREGSETTCSIHDIVVHDLVCLSPGDSVPADGILLRGSVFCDESSLTGESRSAEKIPADPSLTDQQSASPSCLFRGSHITSGSGIMLVKAVGDQTMYGSIAAELAAEETVSPLRERLSRLAKTIAKIGYVSAAIVAAVHLADAFWFDAGMQKSVMLERLTDVRFVISELIQALTLAISIVVVAVPEGLPMMITVVLSSNMKRMLRSGVLVRRLIGIETAGSMDILFTDKTGTLTTGNLTLSKVITGDGSFASPSAIPFTVSQSLTNGARVCSSVHNATECAVNRFFSVTPRPDDITPENQIPFDSSRKYAAGRSREKLYLYGAAEYLLPSCTTWMRSDGTILPLTEEHREKIQADLSQYASAACRILLHAEASPVCFDALKSDVSVPLTFIALSVIRDEIRPEAAPAVKTCRKAGIQVVMLTGDNAETAAAIAEDCGILEKGGQDLVLDGSALRTMSDAELTNVLPKIRVISRVTPTDKSRLVRIAKASGHIAGMTGDGVNDAPALKAADVGFAMGSGTDVAREAGDIVITDDNFASITQAVLFGRTIFRSIRKFITFQLTMNLAAVGVSVLGTIFGIEHPVTVIQMLWVNIIMDTLGSLAFAGESALDEYMCEPPVKRKEHILTTPMVHQILLTGSYAIVLAMYFLLSPKILYLFGSSEIIHLTQFFALFIFMGICIAMCTRTPRINLFSNLSRNRAFLLIMPAVAVIQLLIIYFGGDVFRCVPLSSRELLFCAVFAATVIPADSIRKAVCGLIVNRKA